MESVGFTCMECKHSFMFAGCRSKLQCPKCGSNKALTTKAYNKLYG